MHVGRFRRGARVRACGPLLRGYWKLRAARTGVCLAGKPLSLAEETRHFKLIGTTGAGKSTAIHDLLVQALRRGDRAVIADPDGGYRHRLFDAWRGDVLLNPLEPSSVKWDPFAELQSPGDSDHLAGALVAASGDAAANEWRGYARTFLAAVLDGCLRSGRTDMARLWRLLAVAGSDDLRLLVAGTPAQPFLEPENARMFGSIRAVAMASLRALEHVQVQRGRPFSVRNWVRQGGGVLFMPYAARQIAALRNLIASWMELAIFEALSQPEGDQRLWFVVDELDALGPIDGLKDALARLRKFGGRCVLGFQSVAQVSDTYGPGVAQTLVENCGNTLVLRCSGSEQGGTSQFASRLIGERELLRRQWSRGRDGGGGLFAPASRRSTQVSEQSIVESAVLAAELEQLPDLTGYLKTASQPTWHRVRMARPKRRPLLTGPGNGCSP